MISARCDGACVLTDIASDLRDRFDFAVLWFHEKCELDANYLLDEHAVVDLTDDETRAIKILETLRDTIDAIPPSLLKETEELRNAWPELFEPTLVHGVQVVGFGFFPTSATEFVEVLNRTVQRDARAHEEADARARDHALRLVASG
jgi:hypothetical protein